MAKKAPSSSGWIIHTKETLWLVAAATIPLACSPWTHNAFELPKTAVLKALVLLMGLASLIQAINGRKDRERPSGAVIPRALLWPALTFGGAAALATALSVNPRVSLWGSYERQQGLLTLAAYLGLFLFTAANLRTRAQAMRLLTAIAWSSAPVVADGLLQAVGIDPLGWRTAARPERVTHPSLTTRGACESANASGHTLHSCAFEVKCRGLRTTSPGEGCIVLPSKNYHNREDFLDADSRRFSQI
jgi:hypothetical protein